MPHLIFINTSFGISKNKTGIPALSLSKIFENCFIINKIQERKKARRVYLFGNRNGKMHH